MQEPTNKTGEQTPLKDDQTIDSETNIDKTYQNDDEWYDGEPLQPFKFSCRKLMVFAGPGLLMSIAYLDPGNIQGDMQAGIDGKYHLLWALFWSTCLGLYYQTLAAKIGVVTQRNLARVCKEQYSPTIRYTLWIMTEIAIIAADIQEVIGSATALKILFGLPMWVGVILTILDSFVFLFIHYYGVRKLEFFFLGLITTMTAMFFTNMFYSNPSISLMIEGTVIPSVPAGAWNVTLGLIGAVIMPHNLYLHSALVLSRKIDHKNRTAVNEANIYNLIESAGSLVISFLISTAVISTFAVYAYGHPEANDGITLYKAADVLAETLGSSARYLWAIGLLAAGQSATMTGTYAGQFVMEGFLDWKIPAYQRVLITRFVSIAPALFIAFFNDKELDIFDEFLNILQSIQLPFALVPTIKFASDPNIMREFAIPLWQTVPATIFGTFLFGMNFVLIFVGQNKFATWQYAMIAFFTVSYIAIIIMAILAKTSPLKPLDADHVAEREADTTRVQSMTTARESLIKKHDENTEK